MNAVAQHGAQPRPAAESGCFYVEPTTRILLYQNNRRRSAPQRWRFPLESDQKANSNKSDATILFLPSKTAMQSRAVMFLGSLMLDQLSAIPVAWILATNLALGIVRRRQSRPGISASLILCPSPF